MEKTPTETTYHAKNPNNESTDVGNFNSVLGIIFFCRFASAITAALGILSDFEVFKIKNKIRKKLEEIKKYKV